MFGQPLLMYMNTRHIEMIQNMIIYVTRAIEIKYYYIQQDQFAGGEG